MLRTLVRRDVISRHSLKVSLSSKADPDQKLPFDDIVADVRTYDPKTLLGVSRAFTHFLALSNSAENHHRLRRLRAMTHDSIVALPEKEDSCGGALKRLMTEYKKSPVEIMKAYWTSLITACPWKF